MESSPNRLKAGAYRAAVRLYQITSQHPEPSNAYGRNPVRFATRKLWSDTLPYVLGNVGPSGRPDAKGNRAQRRKEYATRVG